MGLDITVYKGMHPSTKVDKDKINKVSFDYEKFCFPGPSMEWSEKHFPGRGKGLDPYIIYSYEDCYSFRAGSYHGYNVWRDDLEEFAEDNNQFKELIDFADNDGVIGPIVSKKLYNDFKDNKERAIAYSKTFEDGNHWLEKYMDWEYAFKMASDCGAVFFH